MNYFSSYAVKSVRTAVQSIDAIVARELVALTVQRELALGNAVADTTNSGTYSTVSI